MRLTPTASLVPLLSQAAKEQASDVHLTVGLPPVFRINGELQRRDAPPYEEETLLAHIMEILPPDQQKRFQEDRQVDTLTVTPAGERFRVNVFWEKHLPALAARYIPSTIPTLEDLMAPDAAYDFVKLNQGFVLVTGPAGAGKSTLLASLIERINDTRSEHIITLEDPIEFLHQSNKSVVAQRQMGRDFLDFPGALKHVLRQDPDVVLVGEMRDLETIAAAITLAETGHLVFATLHTNNAPETVERIVDAFPAAQQAQIRLQLAFVLRGIIAQILIPKTDGTRIAAHEVLVNNTAIATLIRDARTNQIQNVLWSSTNEHMNTMDQELRWLMDEGHITKETAMGHARNMTLFNQ